MVIKQAKNIEELAASHFAIYDKENNGKCWMKEYIDLNDALHSGHTIKSIMKAIRCGDVLIYKERKSDRI